MQINLFFECQLNQKDCAVCVLYGCKFGDTKYGCPNDFFKECATHTNIINFIKRHDYEDMEYVQNIGVTYISCGLACYKNELEEKYANARLKITNSSVDYCVEAGKPCTEYPTDSPPITSTPATAKPSSQSSTIKPRTSPVTSEPATAKPPSQSSTIKPRTPPTHVDPSGTSPPPAPDLQQLQMFQIIKMVL
uniref:Uncharacterized protein n=1 Tax=Panagrolaimus davidi TaxID=227884 RepID=A0A914PBI0_9BILA